MTFLPIVERELRVAARQRSTFWLRVVAALVALLIGGGCLLLSQAGGIGTASLGGILFKVVTWLALGAALSAGLFFTADCLSEEKREGTLGFLFLTDLRGYEVVTGKLLATSLRCFYALLAVFPILAVTLLMGGVGGAEFWKAVLALVNALFFSLAAGLAVSALSRDAQKALAAALLLLLLLAVGGPLADLVISRVRRRNFAPVLSLASPGYAFALAGAWGRSPYWQGLVISEMVAWAFFVLTCFLIPRTWQEKSGSGTAPIKSWAYALKYGGSRRRAGLRRRLIERNPVLWLACRERWQAMSVWMVAILVAGAFAVPLVVKMPKGIWLFWKFFGGFFVLALYLGTASQASRFFLSARQCGLLEELLVAPVSVEQIVRGQWRGLLRMFGLPVLVLLLLHVVAAGLSQRDWAGAFFPAPGSATPILLMLMGAVVAGITTTANLVAIGWLGMWMGLTSKNNSLATLMTLVFVQVIPWFVINFASWMVTMAIILPLMARAAATSTTVNVGVGSTSGVAVTGWATSATGWILVIPAVLTAVLSVAKDIGFIVWARKKLSVSFRERAGRDAVRPRPMAPPPVLPPPVATPPVIAVKG